MSPSDKRVPEPMADHEFGPRSEPPAALSEKAQPFVCGAMFTVGSVRKRCVRPAHESDGEGHWVVDRSAPPARTEQGQRYEMPSLTPEKVWDGSWGAWLVNVQDTNGHVTLPAEMVQRLLIAAYPRGGR